MVIKNATLALDRLRQGNADFVTNAHNPAKLTDLVRAKTSEEGQEPYAVIVTCSDSRVPPEHIFSAGIGELFVIRTAGNVVDTTALGSIEYGVEHLGAPLVIVMGHTHCGAVAATLEGGATGNVKNITDKIAQHIEKENNPSTCEVSNAAAVAAEIRKSSVIEHLMAEKKVLVTHAYYNIKTGAVTFFEE